MLNPSQPNPTPSPTDEDIATVDWATEKTKLEVKKLRIDLADYANQVALQQKKLKADARDWAYRLLIAAVSTLLGVGTFTAGQLYQRQSDAHKRAIAITERDTRARQYLSQLNDPNVATRTSAVAALAAYVAPSIDTAGHSWFESRWEQDVRQSDRVAQKSLQKDVIRAIAIRLINETDVHSLEEDSRILSSVGELALPDTVSANRVAADEFHRSAGDLLAASLAGSDPRACDSGKSIEAAYKQLDLLVVRAKMPFETQLDEHLDTSGVHRMVGMESSRFKASTVLGDYALSSIMPLECHSVLESRRYSKESPDRAQLERDLLRAARSLAISSLTIVRMVRSLPNHNDRLGMDAVVIVNGLTERADFSNADLENAYIAGAPTSFGCRSCDLANADLRNLKLNAGSDLRGATLQTTHFRAPVLSSVLLDDKWRSSALQYLTECPQVARHLNQIPSCKEE